jgi:quercetin dioxygenase-like cupin family protein
MLKATNLKRQFDAVTEHWSPKVIGRVNDQYLKAAKIKGELVWHKHDEEDELFYVVKGRVVIRYEGGRSVTLEEGDFHIVPKNTLHNPLAEEECWVVLIEPVTTKHTGDVVTDRTRSIEEQLA